MEALWKVEASAWAVRGGGCKEHPLQRKKTVRYEERTTIICRSLPVLGDYMCYLTPTTSLPLYQKTKVQKG